MRLMRSFFSAYPLQTLLMLTALLLSAVAEGIGLSVLLPLLNIALGVDSGVPLPGADAAVQGGFETMVKDILNDLGIAITLSNMLLILVGGVALKSVFLLLAQRQVGYTAAQVGTDLRLQMLHAILRSKWEYFLHQPVGKLTNALATEAERSSRSFVNGATAITFLIQAIIYGSVAIALSWHASLAALVAGAVVIGLSHFLVRVTRKAGKKQTNLLASLMALLTDTLQSVKPLKAMALEEQTDKVLAREANRINKSLRRQVLSAAVLDSAQELMFTVFIALGIYVALEVFSMELPTVMVLVVALGRAFSFLGKVQKQYQKLAQGESAYWSMKATIAEAEEAQEPLDGGLTPDISEGIELKSVHFSYDAHPVFTDLSMKIEAGALTTLIGPSGTGKTTLLDLVLGLIHPDKGNVTLSGTPLQDIDIRAWRKMIGYVPQETILLHDTIEHNITLGDASLREADINKALRAAGAWEFVNALPEGLDMVVGERGGRLSGGQRQRIVIARALVNNPKLLILDEATSALDPDSEQAIRNTMENLKGQLSILAISHNKAMIQAADQVYRLEDGAAHLIEPGLNSELGK